MRSLRSGHHPTCRSLRLIWLARLMRKFQALDFQCFIELSFFPRGLHHVRPRSSAWSPDGSRQLACQPGCIGHNGEGNCSYGVYPHFDLPGSHWLLLPEGGVAVGRYIYEASVACLISWCHVPIVACFQRVAYEDKGSPTAGVECCGWVNLVFLHSITVWDTTAPGRCWSTVMKDPILLWANRLLLPKPTTWYGYF